MPASYAIARMYPEPRIHDDALEYMERIQATMDPFGGRFLVHGGIPDVKEGEFPGVVVILGFPDAESARAWYASEAYAEIKRLRSDHIPGELFLLEGVDEDYDVAKTAAELRRQRDAADAADAVSR
ncbi:DUF1330 domain-containing protein [Actinomadura logoneensis]|uniref:DUF1330 domain-containing protein n=1 Tax=Actinomadura logoneensis TaxID=2293572 RepID=A0A372JN96_9ACTN|nr:DUF1330 domain-containing protein [Actinomadura logoneensis]RFU41485.1 DUF1330 domain-containing protein [Actinomadura logoneensis]